MNKRDGFFLQELINYYLKKGYTEAVARGKAKSSMEKSINVGKTKKYSKSNPQKVKALPKKSGKYWFCGKGTDKIQASVAEQRVAFALGSLKLKYYTEVSFKNLTTAKGGYYRFDFFIPSMRLVIEYDGKHHFKSTTKKKDNIKDKFCSENNIRVLRFNCNHWASLEESIIQSIKSL